MINIFFSFKFILHKINISTEKGIEPFFLSTKSFFEFSHYNWWHTKKCEFWEAMDWKITFKWVDWVGSILMQIFIYFSCFFTRQHQIVWMMRVFAFQIKQQALKKTRRLKYFANFNSSKRWRNYWADKMEFEETLRKDTRNILSRRKNLERSKDS